MTQVLSDAEARRAIQTDLDTTLIVEAAAGTGKTTELVKRILAVLSTGRARIEQIVAVTFTEKAAGELKLRLREKLEEERARHDVRPPQAAGGIEVVRLEAALAKLEEAHVNTIHGFCADLLRERPVEARVDPIFRVLTEPEADRLYSRAFAAWLQETLKDPPEGVRRALRRTSMPSFGERNDGPIGRLRGAGRALADSRDFPHPWSRPAFDRRERIDHTQAAILMPVPVEPDRFVLLLNNVLDEFHHRARAIWCRVSHRVADAYCARATANRRRVERANRFRIGARRVFGDKHHRQAFTHRERHSLFRHPQKLIEGPLFRVEANR